MVGYVLDIDSEDKQKLLEMTSTAERLQVLVNDLTDSIRKMEQQVAYKGLVSKVRGRFTSFSGETQHFKVPHLRNQYQKVGMFGRPTIGSVPGHGTPASPQVRGCRNSIRAFP